MKISWRIAWLGMVLCMPCGAEGFSHNWFAEQEPPLLYLGGGVGDILDDHPQVGWTLEYRPALRLFHVGPWFSLGRGKDRETYASAGVLINLQLGGRWLLTPSFGAGYYTSGDGLDLGHELEFRSGIECTYRFNNGSRLGCAFAHLSNGGIVDRNPGTELLLLMYGFPLGGSSRTAK